jgi:hypothetical protein
MRGQMFVRCSVSLLNHHYLAVSPSQPLVLSWPSLFLICELIHTDPTQRYPILALSFTFFSSLPKSEKFNSSIMLTHFTPPHRITHYRRLLALETDLGAWRTQQLDGLRTVQAAQAQAAAATRELLAAHDRGVLSGTTEEGKPRWKRLVKVGELPKSLRL